MKIYCMRCRKKTANVGQRLVKVKNGRLMYTASCANCGTKKFQAASKRAV